MCGRSSLTKSEKEIEERFQASFYSDDLVRYNTLPNFNITPTSFQPVITQENVHQLLWYRWGLIPQWAQDAKIGSSMINARVETLLEKNVFKPLLLNNRCIVPLDGFYEWKAIGKKIKVPYRITLNDENLFAVAGLCTQWVNPQGQLIHSLTIITQEPNELMSTIHDRMPAILKPEDEVSWLSSKLSINEALSLIEPYDSNLMKAYRVSDRINKASENDIELIEEVSDEPFDEQLSLFS